MKLLPKGLKVLQLGKNPGLVALIKCTASGLGKDR
jgi:hypothetical protein